MNFRYLHSWNLSPAKAIKVHGKLKKMIKLKPLKFNPRLITGADVAFEDKKAVAVVIVFSYPELKIVESVRRKTKIPYKYIPGLLTFREGPVLEKCFRELKNEPDVIIFDGQGIAHPRMMGIATHMGILLDKPTIG